MNKFYLSKLIMYLFPFIFIQNINEFSYLMMIIGITEICFMVSEGVCELATKDINDEKLTTIGAIMHYRNASFNIAYN